MIFHEIKVHYDRQTGEDNPGKAKEVYLIDGAVSFSDAEKCLIEEIKPFVFGDCEVHNCKRSQFFDIFPNEGGAYWYKARVEMITIDNDKETRKAVNFYAQANNITEANKAIHQAMGNEDFEVASITRTKLVDVIRAIH